MAILYFITNERETFLSTLHNLIRRVITTRRLVIRWFGYGFPLTDEVLLADFIAVYVNNDGLSGVDYGVMVPLRVRGLQTYAIQSAIITQSVQPRTIQKCGIVCDSTMHKRHDNISDI